MTSERDIVVIGAGVVGVSAALHLQKRGRSVTLIDRRDPGEETSYGNTGVIEGGTYVPISMPTNPFELIKFLPNTGTAMHFHWRAMPKLVSWLMQLRANSGEAALRKNGGAVMALLAHAIAEHKALMAEAGAEGYLRETGWVRIYRTEAQFAEAGLERRIADETGHKYTVLDPGQLREIEPHIKPVFKKAELWHDIASLTDPGGTVKAYAALFSKNGGTFERTGARRLTQTDAGWSVETDSGSLQAKDVVVALGPWAMDLLSPLGYRLPFAVKRGYHMHFRPSGNAGLSRPIVDMGYGYAASSMAMGLRVTTGIEFADRDAAPTPVQLDRILPHVRELLPIEDALEPTPWMGRRPSFPDSVPVIGPAPRHPGLWLDFGHAHLGLTLGPISGRLIAEMITGEAPVVDPAAYSAARFG